MASLASKSIGPGTRANLDEFTYTTSNAIERVGGARKGKALAIINPADPPMMMRNTIQCLCDDEPDQARITASILAMIAEVQKYVPGYQLVNGPLFDGKAAWPSTCRSRAWATTCPPTPATWTS